MSAADSLLTALTAVHASMLGGLAVFGLHRGWLAVRCPSRAPVRPPEAAPTEEPELTVQLPVFNERHVVERLLRAAAALDWPTPRLQIQVLDDSTDDTTEIVARLCHELSAQRPGLRIEHVRREQRHGFKAGALAHALPSATGEWIAIFDADFVPPGDFLRRLAPEFAEPRVGLVQARWGHLHRETSLLTELQAILLDGHFGIEHTVRWRHGHLFNFNGTAGVWRKRCIEDAGGWQAHTLTEDLDLSYRAQLAGWRFVYREDVACPSELPADANAFLNQQYRWAKGGIQTARKLLYSVLRAGTLSVGTKIEAGFHLLGNAAFVLLLGVIVTALPLHGLRWALDRDPPALLGWFEAVPLLLATVSVLFYYGSALARRGLLDWRRGLMLPLVLAMGAGLSINNTAAVFGGLRRRRGEFVRTPKQGHEPVRVAEPASRYRAKRTGFPIAECALGTFELASATLAVGAGLPISAAFHLLFASGLLWIGSASWRAQRCPTSAPQLDPSPSQA